MIQEKIGKFILEQRKKLGLTQNELAEKLMVTSQAVSKWENARGIPDIEMLNKLSEIFNVDIKDIINGEKTLEKEKNRNVKTYIIVCLSIVVVVLLIMLLLLQRDNFKFHSLSSENSCFGVNGVIAYNKNKKSIYISNIECSNEDVREFLDIECILYEKNGDIDKRIYEFGKINDYSEYDSNELKTLNELLSNVEFNIDSYDCSCEKKNCNNLYIRVNALNIDNEVVTYDIPIELDNKCVK